MSKNEKMSKEENSKPENSEENNSKMAEQPAENIIEKPSTKENTENTSVASREEEVNSSEDKIASEKESENTSEEKAEKPAEKEVVNPSEEKIVSEGESKNASVEKAEKPVKKEVVSPSEEKIASEKESENTSEEKAEKPAERDSGASKAQSEMDQVVAEESEDESSSERHGILKKEYHTMSKEALIAELERLIKQEKIQLIKEHVDEIRTEFQSKYEEEVEEKKEAFLVEGGNIIDFYYSTPLKKQFNSVYFDYKEKRSQYYQQLKQDLKKNLEKRLEIIEELKGLIDVEENINTTYKQFKELQEKWRNAGAIPRDAYNTVWNTYHHHVENFYDFLHLNREFRDLDFKYNLEQKLKIIIRAEELTQEPDTNRAFRELQMLHKMWKEDLGPVERGYREDIWDKFSAATKKIHDKRQQYFEQLEKEFEKNLEKKQEIISQIREIAQMELNSHKQWQQKIKEIEALRETFFNAGKVPRQVNEQTWKTFKEAVRKFNRSKNAFYKNQKKGQFENLEKKRELVKIAEENQDNPDMKATTTLMKKIQNDWKKIGHVPRKDSDKVWKRFKNACNHFFDRLHASRTEENKDEMEAFDKKKSLLDSLKTMKFSGERSKDLPEIKSFIEQWKNSGKVPQSRRFIEGKFNKALDQAFEKLDMDKTQTELLKYENKIQALENSDDSRKIINEHYFLSKKIEETKTEIRQLENNLQFFSNANADNPLVKEVHKNIQNHKDQLEIWKEKLEKVKSLY